MTDRDLEKAFDIKEQLKLNFENLTPFLNKMTTHHYEIAILNDSTDEQAMVKSLQQDHQRLEKDMLLFLNAYSKLKGEVSDVLKSTLKRFRNRTLTTQKLNKTANYLSY
ncbi:MAG: hypothetical protein V7767_00820 [Leeuwenhoekiella sp.]